MSQMATVTPTRRICRLAVLSGEVESRLYGYTHDTLHSPIGHFYITVRGENVPCDRSSLMLKKG